MHVVAAFSALPLFLGALLSDWAYASTYQVQWSNFASWLIAGGLVLVGVALALALFGALRGAPGREGRRGRVAVVLLVGFAVGLVNALVHAKDGWATMPAALWLSALTVAAVSVAGLLGWSGLRREAAR